MSDFLAASVVNQKMVNQHVQQVLVAIAAQVVKVCESQVAISTQEDREISDY